MYAETSSRRLTNLSARELEVLQEMVNGRGPSQLAEPLYISKHTARTHVKNILSKMGVHSCLEAVSIAVSEGMAPSIGPDAIRSMG